MARRPSTRRPSDVSSIRRCVKRIGWDQFSKPIRCTETGTIFAMGVFWCAAHDPPGDPHCTHSAGSERCAYCGGIRP